METKFADNSIVILAAEHNPTVLNPDFLLRNSIISEEWGLSVVGQPITTPAFSTVVYSKNITISLEPNKFQVTDASGCPINKSIICELVRRYVDVLPHVKYQALGLNFTKLTTVTQDGTNFILDRFFKNNVLPSVNGNDLVNIGFNCTYEIDGGVLSLTINKGAQKGVDEPFIVTRGNIHRNLGQNSESNIPKEINLILSNTNKDLNIFESAYNSIIKGN